MNSDHQIMWNSRHSAESLIGYCLTALSSVSGAATTTTSDDLCVNAKVSKQQAAGGLLQIPSIL